MPASGPGSDFLKPSVLKTNPNIWNPIHRPQNKDARSTHVLTQPDTPKCLLRTFGLTVLYSETVLFLNFSFMFCLPISLLLQIDLRDDPKTITKLNDVKEKPIGTEQGQKLAKEVRQ